MISKGSKMAGRGGTGCVSGIRRHQYGKPPQSLKKRKAGEKDRNEQRARIG